MGEEVTGSVTGGNGERLEIRLGSRTIGIQAKDLIPILLLLLIGVGGYLLYESVHKDLGRLERNQEKMTDVVTENRVKILEALQHWQAGINAQTDDMRRMLTTHDYNTTQEPGAHLPLEVPAPRTSGPLGEERR